MAHRVTAYPESIRRYARKLYQVDGVPPAAIAPRCANAPIDTVKGWLRGLKRGVAAIEEAELPLWDFVAASREDRVTIAPLFAQWRVMTDEKTGEDLESDPEDFWPVQDVGDWFIRLAPLQPDQEEGTLLDARFVALLERRMKAGTATEQDVQDYRSEIAGALKYHAIYVTEAQPDERQLRARAVVPPAAVDDIRRRTAGKIERLLREQRGEAEPVPASTVKREDDDD